MKSTKDLLLEVAKASPNLRACGSFGSHAGVERDIFFVLDSEQETLSAEAISQFAVAFLAAKQSTLPASKVFLLDSHRHLMNAPTAETLHVLFYPSFAYLEAWELPSFVSYFNHKAWFEWGSVNASLDRGLRYERRELLCENMTRLHLARYSSLAVNYFLYSKISDLFESRLEAVVDKLAYAIRFTAIEFLNRTTAIKGTASVLDWDELATFKNNLPSNGAQALQATIGWRNHNRRPSLQFVDYLFKLYCEFFGEIIREAGIAKPIGKDDAFNSLPIPPQNPRSP